MAKNRAITAPAQQHRWGPRMMLILAAMFSVAGAFFAGLYVQAQLPFIPSLIGGFAIFMTLFGTLPKSKAQSSSAELQARIAHFEKDIGALGNQLQQFSGLPGKIGQLDELAPTLAQLESFIVEMKLQSSALAANQGEQTELKFGELSQKLKQLDGRIANLNQQVASGTVNQQAEEQLQGQLQTQIAELDQMVRKMAQQAPAAVSAAPATQEFAPEPGAVLQGQAESTVKKALDEIEHVPNPVASQNEGGGAASLSPEEVENRMLALISQAIEKRHMDVYLQPVVQLPKRKTRYYEVFTRLHSDNNSLIMPDMFVPVAERAGLMPLIDNMMLLRAIRIIRRMDKHSHAQKLFCSLSTQSLVDPDFFPKLVNFLENNRDLSGRIIFEISQAQKKAAGHIERENMSRLARLGFSFSLDKVIDLDIDFGELARNHYKYVRISADRLINGMAELGARIHGEDKADYLERFGLRLIVERIETERQLVILADYNIKLGQGYLFAEPRPVRPEVLGIKAA